MKTKIRKKQFTYKLYRSSLILIYGPDHSSLELFNYLRKLDPEMEEYVDSRDDWNQTAAMVFEPTQKRKIYIIVSKTCDITDLVHECSHITHYLFQGIGSQHTSDSDENYSYTLDTVFEDLYSYILKFSDEAHLTSFLRLSVKNNEIN